MSPPGAAVPFTIRLEGGLERVRFGWAGAPYAYHLYVADTTGALLSGAWSHRLCDLAANGAGTLSTDGASWVEFATSGLPSGLLAVVAEEVAEGPTESCRAARHGRATRTGRHRTTGAAPEDRPAYSLSAT